jgi:hypothetical protein
MNKLIAIHNLLQVIAAPELFLADPILSPLKQISLEDLKSVS